MAINFKTTKNMATIKNGFLDAFEGKLGPAVGYRWKGRPCVRSYQPYPHDPCTPAQLAHRRLFGTISRLGSYMLKAVQIGFRGPATEHQTTEKNCFVRTNKGCVSLNGDEVCIDYSALVLADGSLQTVEFGQPQVEGVTVTVPFAADAGQANDYVLLYAYAPSLCRGQLSLPAYRHQEGVAITLPDRWTGLDVHLYGFCWDRNLQCSPSTYLGQLIF